MNKVLGENRLLYHNGIKKCWPHSALYFGAGLSEISTVQYLVSEKNFSINLILQLSDGLDLIWWLQ